MIVCALLLAMFLFVFGFEAFIAFVLYLSFGIFVLAFGFAFIFASVAVKGFFFVTGAIVAISICVVVLLDYIKKLKNNRKYSRVDTKVKYEEPKNSHPKVEISEEQIKRMLEADRHSKEWKP